MFSWGEGQSYLPQVALQFERLWSGTDADWISLDIPQAARERLLQYRPAHAPEVDPLERAATVKPVKDDQAGVHRRHSSGRAHSLPVPARCTLLCPNASEPRRGDGGHHAVAAPNARGERRHSTLPRLCFAVRRGRPGQDHRSRPGYSAVAALGPRAALLDPGAQVGAEAVAGGTVREVRAGTAALRRRQSLLERS